MRAWASLTRACAPAWLLTLPALLWIGDALQRASWATLGRDQGIFQYVAWASSEGDVLYRDVRDVNGPVIAMIHLAFQKLGGTDEHRFRVLDLVVTSASFLVAGALASIGIAAYTRRRSRGAAATDAREGAREAPDAPPLTDTWITHASWALGTWSVLVAQYVAYGFWETAQRESFLDWFVAIAIGLLLLDVTPRREPLVLALAGAFSFVPWLGKPTFALFTFAQLVGIALEPTSDATTTRAGVRPIVAFRVRAKRIASFLGGGALGLAGPLLFLLARGDVRAWATISFVDVPAMYRFIWPRTARAILSLPGYTTSAALALTTTFGLLVLVVAKRLPPRAIGLALLPTCGLLSAVVQAKGFPYHMHPVSFGTSLGWVVAVLVTWNRIIGRDGKATEASDRSERIFAAVVHAVALGCAAALGVRAAITARTAPYPDAPAVRDEATLTSLTHLAPYDRVDYFPYALRRASAYVAQQTAPNERVFAYGMDAYLLFLARRRSATPYIYAYDLNVDAALAGSYEDDGPHPDARAKATIRAMRDAHEVDVLARLEREPPPALVFIDKSPLMSSDDAVSDFAAHCPATALWIASRYRETADFDGIRVWLRNDRDPKP